MRWHFKDMSRKFVHFIRLRCIQVCETKISVANFMLFLVLYMSELHKRKNVRINAIERSVHITFVAIKKSIAYSLSGALATQHAKRMCRVLLTSVAYLALRYYSTLFHKRYDFWEEFIERKLCVLIFVTTFVSNISHSKKNSARYCHQLP
jgi:TRAP-type uncharacterized transport system fused permease subunit